MNYMVLAFGRVVACCKALFSASMHTISMVVWGVGLLGCHDLHNWESRYTSDIKLTFEPVNDPVEPTLPAHFKSAYLRHAFFEKKWKKVSLVHDKREISFELEDMIYYQQVTISYDVVGSLISPNAGGGQYQYTIRNVSFKSKAGKKKLFEQFKINQAVPLAKDEGQKVHVTLLY